MPHPAAASSTYRFDLDGLRGIAIALVVVFHVFVGRVSGGVDVFLLLSGFFFLGSQLRYAGRPEALLSPWWPIWRTARRLVPALVLTLLATFGLARLATPGLLTGDFYGQLAASLLYIQNLELAAQEADYAAASPETSPLQHLWSMSVQGQFYCAAIALSLALAALGRLAGGRRHPKRLARVVTFGGGAVLLAATVASFGYAARFGLIGTPGNYYDFLARAWELTLGGLLALIAPVIRLPRLLRAPASALGVIMVAITGILIENTLAFPGPLALFPLTGAALVILGGSDGSNGNPVAAALASRPARLLGDIAYPLYLWHWPLLIIATAYLGQPRPAWWLGLGIVAISLVLAWATNRLVERPLQQHRRRPVAGEGSAVRTAWRRLRAVPAARWRAVGGVVTAAAVVLTAAQLPLYYRQVNREAEVAERGFDPADYPGALAATAAAVPDLPYRPNPQLVGDIFPDPGYVGCLTFKPAPADEFAETKDDGTPCVYGDPDADTTVVLAGGSHAEQWMTPLDALGREHGFKVVPVLRQECPIVLGPDVGVSPQCAQWAAAAVERIIELAPAAVVSTSTRPLTATGIGPDHVPESYVAFWDALADAAIPLVGLRDNPWGIDYESPIVPSPPSDLTLCLVDLGDAGACGMDREDVYAAVDPAAAGFASRFPDFEFVDTADWFCSTTRCEAVRGNVVVYRDQNHISNAFAATTAPLLWEHLRTLVRG